MSNTLSNDDCDKLLACKFPLNKLIKRGYAFHKLYAANYKVYQKSFGKFKHAGPDIWVWAVHGGYIEIDGWYSRTKLVLKIIKDNWEFTKASGKPYMILLRCIKTGEYSYSEHAYNPPMDKDGNITDYLYETEYIHLEEFKRVLDEVEVLTNGI